MAQYGLETEVTHHLKGMTLGGGQGDIGRKTFVLYDTINTNGTIRKSDNTKDAHLYTCNYLGRYGTSSGSAIVLIHEDISRSGSAGFNTQSKAGGESAYGFGDIQYAYSLYAVQPIGLQCDCFVWASSIEELQTWNGNIYGFSDFQPYEFPQPTGGVTTIGYSYVEVID